MLAVRGLCQEVDGVLEGLPQAEFNAFEVQLSGFDLGEVQDLIDDVQEAGAER